MNSILIGAIVFVCTFGGAVLGVVLRAILKEHHLDTTSKDTVKVGIALVATMTALVLGLVTASSKGYYDSVDAAVRQSATQILALDRLLHRYGPETAEIRNDLKQMVGSRIEAVWSSKPAGNVIVVRSTATSPSERLADAIRDLQPNNDRQKALQSRAVDLSETILQTKWLMLTHSRNVIPVPFLVVMLFWLTIIFVSYGIYTQPNVLVIVALLVCALSVSGALCLVLEMDSPFDGLVRVSAQPMRQAYEYLNQ
jgi:hypothetical protein